MTAFDDLGLRPTIRFATTGRITGRRHEKWWIPFAVDGDVIYLIEETPDAQWIHNIDANANVDVGSDQAEWRPAVARRVVDADEQARARALVAAKFDEGEWWFIRDGLVIAFEPRR